jgi:GNAT superfamily N-acetyltransferase
MIRPVEYKDVEACISLGYLMHQESHYRFLNYSAVKIVNLIERSKTNPDSVCIFVAEKDEEIIGFFVGLKTEYWFSDDSMTCDLVMYVKPEHRGCTAAPRLIKAYETWASGLDVKEINIGTSTDVNSERTIGLYKRLGYSTASYSFRKRSQ